MAVHAVESLFCYQDRAAAAVLVLRFPFLLSGAEFALFRRSIDRSLETVMVNPFLRVYPVLANSKSFLFNFLQVLHETAGGRCSSCSCIHDVDMDDETSLDGSPGEFSASISAGLERMLAAFECKPPETGWNSYRKSLHGFVFTTVAIFFRPLKISTQTIEVE